MKELSQPIKYQSFDIQSLPESEKLLFEKAKITREKAYAPYSKFYVGCAIQLDNGEIIMGNNQENAAYPSGTCAERTAVFYANSRYPSIRIESIWIVGGPMSSDEHLQDFPPVPPCGACRQVLLEYEQLQEKPIQVFFSNLYGNGILVSSVQDLLPFSFGASYL